MNNWGILLQGILGSAARSQGFKNWWAWVVNARKWWAHALYCAQTNSKLPQHCNWKSENFREKINFLSQYYFKSLNLTTGVFNFNFHSYKIAFSLQNVDFWNFFSESAKSSTSARILKYLSAKRNIWCWVLSKVCCKDI